MKESFTCIPHSIWERELTMDERYMYIYLLDCENKFNKMGSWFGITNSDFIEAGFGKNQSVLRNVRKGLIEKGLIDYKPGHSGVKSRYLIRRSTDMDV